jgi:hypothetical protein
MTRWFNTAGPCRPERHYMLSPIARLSQVERLVDRESYFVIHAPRQIGKTTAISIERSMIQVLAPYNLNRSV